MRLSFSLSCARSACVARERGGGEGKRKRKEGEKERGSEVGLEVASSSPVLAKTPNEPNRGEGAQRERERESREEKEKTWPTLFVRVVFVLFSTLH